MDTEADENGPDERGSKMTVKQMQTAMKIGQHFQNAEDAEAGAARCDAKGTVFVGTNRLVGDRYREIVASQKGKAEKLLQNFPGGMRTFYLVRATAFGG